MKRLQLFISFMLLSIVVFGENFVLENTGLIPNKKDSIQIAEIIKYQIDFYNRIAAIDSIHIKLRIIEDSASYTAAQIETFKRKEKCNLGFYSIKKEEATIYKRKKAKYIPLIAHEISHYFTHRILKKPPRWLGEGLSEYFEHTTIKTKNGKATHLITDYEIGRIKTMIEINDLDLKDFFTWDVNEFMEKQKTDDSYTYILSHCIVNYLIITDFNQFKSIVLKLKEGKKTIDAIEEIYPGGYKKFDADFRNYYYSIQL